MNEHEHDDKKEKKNAEQKFNERKKHIIVGIYRRFMQVVRTTN